MRYNGTDFNPEVLRSMTKAQFLLVGGRGNSLTEKELAEAYDLIVGKKPKNANDSKSTEGGKQD